MDLKIGADPELFLKDKKTQQFVSAFGVIPGTKAAPHPVSKGAVQVDGMALEFNVNPTNETHIFIENINTILKTLREMVPHNFEFDFSSIVHFNKSYLDEQPDVAKMLGCDPDFNAYSGEKNTPPDVSEPIRTAAGHIHIGWCEGEKEIGYQHYEEARAFTRQLDYMLGVPSLLLDDGAERREIYGKAGAFRPKKYGVEYRVLSNFWLKDVKLMQWVFDSTQKAFSLLAEQNINLFERYGDTAKEFIDTNDAEGARLFLEEELHPFVTIEGVK